MNFAQNVHLLGFKIRKIPSGFDLMRQSREQAMVSKTPASMSVGGHALPPHPLILKWLMPLIPTRPQGWSGGAMVLGKLPVPGRPTILITVGQGPIALAVGAGGGGLDIFTLIYPFSSFSLSLGDGPI